MSWGEPLQNYALLSRVRKMVCFLSSTVLAYNTWKAPEICMNLQVSKTIQLKTLRHKKALFKCPYVKLSLARQLGKTERHSDETAFQKTRSKDNLALL